MKAAVAEDKKMDYDYRRLMEVARRDEQALWVCEAYYAVMETVTSARAWYAGEKNAALPERFLSTVMQPGSDGDHGLRHRLLSLARDMHQRDPPTAEPFQRFKTASYEVLKTIGITVDFAEIKEAREALDSMFDYLGRMEGRKREDERFSERVLGMAEKFLDAWERLTGSVARLERQLSGQGPGDVELRGIARQCDAIERGINALRRIDRVSVSIVTRRFVVDSVRKMMSHPAACAGNVSRRRVYIRDVWETVKATATEKHHIRDFNEFRRIYETAMRANRRAEISA